jgi:hypothetical protein
VVEQRRVDAVATTPADVAAGGRARIVLDVLAVAWLASETDLALANPVEQVA